MAERIEIEVHDKGEPENKKSGSPSKSSSAKRKTPTKKPATKSGLAQKTEAAAKKAREAKLVEESSRRAVKQALRDAQKNFSQQTLNLRKVLGKEYRERYRSKEEEAKKREAEKAKKAEFKQTEKEFKERERMERRAQREAKAAAKEEAATKKRAARESEQAADREERRERVRQREQNRRAKEHMQNRKDFINDVLGAAGRSRAGYRINRGLDLFETVKPLFTKAKEEAKAEARTEANQSSATAAGRTQGEARPGNQFEPSRWAKSFYETMKRQFSSVFDKAKSGFERVFNRRPAGPASPQRNQSGSTSSTTFNNPEFNTNSQASTVGGLNNWIKSSIFNRAKQFVWSKVQNMFSRKSTSSNQVVDATYRINQVRNNTVGGNFSGGNSIPPGSGGGYGGSGTPGGGAPASGGSRGGIGGFLMTLPGMGGGAGGGGGGSAGTAAGGGAGRFAGLMKFAPWVILATAALGGFVLAIRHSIKAAGRMYESFKTVETGAVVMARVMNSLENTRFNIERGQRYGGAMAAYEDSRGRLERSRQGFSDTMNSRWLGLATRFNNLQARGNDFLSKLLDTISKFTLDPIIKMMEIGLDGMEIVTEVFSGGGEGFWGKATTLFDVMTLGITIPIRAIHRHLTKEAKEKNTQQDLTRQLYDFIGFGIPNNAVVNMNGGLNF